MNTIKDIAKAAGVSVTTVSRALNGYSDVNEQTRQRIQEVAEQLDYAPNHIARGLVMNRSKTIGLLTSQSFPSNSKDAPFCVVKEYSRFRFMLELNWAASGETPLS